MSSFNNNTNNRTTIPTVIATGRSSFRPATAGNRLSVDQLVEKLSTKYRELEERTKELEKERTRRGDPWERETIGRNPEQSRWIRQFYKEYCVMHNMPGWIVTSSLDKSQVNQDIRDYIIRKLAVKIIGVNAEMTDTDNKNICIRIRNNYENHRRNYKKKTEMAADELFNLQNRHNMRQRLTQVSI
ncbi:hypothetical protein BD770DRAFT_129960 [Pilaira anomala]|nr:hypothetical protein BD770DRAFT_129960 [Pilaira anomala]